MYNGCFKNLDTPEKTYWFGFIVGDGCIGVYKNGGYTFVMTLKDKEHVEKLANFLGYQIDRIKIHKAKNIIIKNRLCNRKELYTFRIKCKELVIDLMNLGLTPRKSLTITDSIIPKNYQWDFIRGLWDADGCIYFIKSKNINLLNPAISLVGNYPLLEGIKNIINNGGHLRNGRVKDGHIDSLYYGGRKKVENILDKMYYCPPYLNRKFNLYKIIIEYSAKYNAKGHKPSKYAIYNDGISYLEQDCLYCGNKFLLRTNVVNKKGNIGKFCSLSHAGLYKWNLKKEVINYATC